MSIQDLGHDGVTFMDLMAGIQSGILNVDVEGIENPPQPIDGSIQGDLPFRLANEASGQGLAQTSQIAIPVDANDSRGVSTRFVGQYTTPALNSQAAAAYNAKVADIKDIVSSGLKLNVYITRYNSDRPDGTHCVWQNCLVRIHQYNHSEDDMMYLELIVERSQEYQSGDGDDGPASKRTRSSTAGLYCEENEKVEVQYFDLTDSTYRVFEIPATGGRNDRPEGWYLEMKNLSTLGFKRENLLAGWCVELLIGHGDKGRIMAGEWHHWVAISIANCRFGTGGEHDLPAGNEADLQQCVESHAEEF